MCVYMFINIYIYIYIHTYIHIDNMMPLTNFNMILGVVENETSTNQLWSCLQRHGGFEVTTCFSMYYPLVI